MEKPEKNELQLYEAGTYAQDLGVNGLAAFADADYAASYTRRSTSGFALYLNGGPVAWGSKLQKVVATSTAEAEINAATEAVKEAVRSTMKEAVEEADDTVGKIL